MKSIVTLVRRVFGVAIVGTAAVTYSGEDVVASILVDAFEIGSTSRTPLPSRPAVSIDVPQTFGQIDAPCIREAAAHGAAIVRRVDFAAPVSIDDLDKLSTEARTLFTEPMAHDDVYGHALAFDLLARCHQASLLKTQSMIRYRDTAEDTTDYLARLGGQRVAVKVVRAPERPALVTDVDAVATAALPRLLNALQAGRARAWPADRWDEHVLFVLTDSTDYAAAFERAWSTLSDSARADTLLWVAVTDGHDDFLYGAPLALR